MSTFRIRGGAASLLGVGVAVATGGWAATAATAAPAASAQASQATATGSELAWSDGQYWTETDPSGAADHQQIRVSGNGFVFGVDRISEVAFSPDGSTAAFVHSSPGAPAIWVSDADGGNARALPSGSQTPSNLAFSPDGKLVFFDELNPVSGKQEIFFVPVDGSAGPKMYNDGTFDLGQIAFSSKGQYAIEDDGAIEIIATVTMNRTQSLDGFRAPRWSPDGAHLLAIATATGDLVIMSPDGLVQHTVVSADPAAHTTVGQAAWSPDSSRVVYTLVTDRSGQGLPDQEQLWEQDAVAGATPVSVSPVQPAGTFGHLTWSAAYTPPSVPPPQPTPTPTPTPAPPGSTPPPSGASASVTRIGGGDRYATARLVSQKQWANGTADAVVLARGDQAPDALAGVPLAAHVHGPLLLTDPAALDQATRAEIDRATGGPKASKTVYILGGGSAVSPSIEVSLRKAGYTVVRYRGEDRFGTALAVAAAFGKTARVLVATGTDFPDALAAGPLGAVEDAPIVLSQGNTIDPATASFILSHSAIDPVGGYAQRAVATLNTTGRTVDHGLAGPTRYETAVAVANALVAETHHVPTAVGIASGVTFPDALTGGAFAANAGMPLLITEPTTLSEPARACLAGWVSQLTAVTVFGGPAAVTAGTETQIAAAVHGRVE